VIKRTYLSINNLTGTVLQGLLKHLSIEPFENMYNLRLLPWAGHVARILLIRAPIKILALWVDNPRPRGCPQMNWGRTLKRPFRVTTFQLSLSNSARWQLIAINGAQFALLKCRMQQKRHRPPPDKTSGLSSYNALCHHKYKNLLASSR
jgi:hypothetical protein